jgi:tetratricopeptide (TPR) repeat protein
VDYSIGKDDNQNFKSDFENYTKAIQLVQAKQTEQAIIIFKDLDGKYPKNVYINKYLGLAYTLEGDYKMGLSYFQECLAMNPATQLDPSFMLQYGQILYYNGEFEKAKEVFNVLNSDEHYKQVIDDFLSKSNVKGQH